MLGIQSKGLDLSKIDAMFELIGGTCMQTKK